MKEIGGKMDSHETLDVARTIKERGNAFFKRGHLPEAQRTYVEVLAMLTEKITLTRNEQRKEKETLVLSAHLNLAQCALQLGNDANVIYHCNTVLDMDTNNIKAHYRKARAFENRAEFAKALAGYQHVLVLEPDNKTVQRQLSECKKKLDSQRAEEQLSTKVAEQEDQGIDDEDVETVYEDSENDPQTRYKKCKKNPGHEKFISVNDFRIEDLPPAYRDPELFNYIIQQGKITVMLKVWPPRKSRPGCCPGIDRNNSENPGPRQRVRPLKHGSGWILMINLHIEKEQPCPCHTCKNLGSPEKRWAEILISTAAHVVRNEIEASNTECYLFYDTKEVDLSSCPLLSNAMMEYSIAEYDSCVLKFISHDISFSESLEEIHSNYAVSCGTIKRRYSAPASEGSWQEQCQHLWQRFEKLTKEFGHLVKQVSTVLNGDPHKELEKHRRGREDKLGNDLLGQLLLNKMWGGVEFQGFLDDMQRNHQRHCDVLAEIPEYVTRFRLEPDGDYSKSVYYWQAWVKALEKIVILLRNMPDETATVQPQEPDHSLTVIVSHPHGCSKKITLGKVTERTNEQFSQFTYTTPTCPGSSGAMVFILGEGMLFSGHAHSAMRSAGPLEQLNQSASYIVL